MQASEHELQFSARCPHNPAFRMQLAGVLKTLQRGPDMIASYPGLSLENSEMETGMHFHLSYLVQEIFQLLASGGMAQLPQGLGLDLTDTLTGDVELLAHFLQRAGAAVLDAKAQLQHVFLTGRQGGQHVHQLLL